MAEPPTKKASPFSDATYAESAFVGQPARRRRFGPVSLNPWQEYYMFTRMHGGSYAGTKPPNSSPAPPTGSGLASAGSTSSFPSLPPTPQAYGGPSPSPGSTLAASRFAAWFKGGGTSGAGGDGKQVEGGDEQADTSTDKEGPKSLPNSSPITAEAGPQGPAAESSAATSAPEAGATAGPREGNVGSQVPSFFITEGSADGRPSLAPTPAVLELLREQAVEQQAAVAALHVERERVRRMQEDLLSAMNAMTSLIMVDSNDNKQGSGSGSGRAMQGGFGWPPQLFSPLQAPMQQQQQQWAFPVAPSLPLASSSRATSSREAFLSPPLTPNSYQKQLHLYQQQQQQQQLQYQQMYGAGQGGPYPYPYPYSPEYGYGYGYAYGPGGGGLPLSPLPMPHHLPPHASSPPSARHAHGAALATGREMFFSTPTGPHQPRSRSSAATVTADRDRGSRTRTPDNTAATSASASASASADAVFRRLSRSRSAAPAVSMSTNSGSGSSSSHSSSVVDVSASSSLTSPPLATSASASLVFPFSPVRRLSLSGSASSLSSRQQHATMAAVAAAARSSASRPSSLSSSRSSQGLLRTTGPGPAVSKRQSESEMIEQKASHDGKGPGGKLDAATTQLSAGKQDGGSGDGSSQDRNDDIARASSAASNTSEGRRLARMLLSSSQAALIDAKDEEDEVNELLSWGMSLPATSTSTSIAAGGSSTLMSPIANQHFAFHRRADSYSSQAEQHQASQVQARRNSGGYEPFSP